MKRLRSFDLPSADFDHAMIRVGDSAQIQFSTSFASQEVGGAYSHLEIVYGV